MTDEERRQRVRLYLGDGWAQVAEDDLIDHYLDRADDLEAEMGFRIDKEQRAAFWVRLWWGEVAR